MTANTPKSSNESPKFYISKQAIRFTNTQIYTKASSKNSYKQQSLSPESVNNISNLETDPVVKQSLTGWNPGQGVTLCIPESSVFTKIVEINLPIQEMHETVIWQVQNYLPRPADQMIIDWQILKENGSSTTVQVVAAPKDLIEKYVDILRNYGVKVVDIDTPSMVLSRIAANQSLPGLFIDAESESVIMIGLDKNTIDLVSVVPDPQDIPQVVSQMINYVSQKYNIEIINIYISGSQSQVVSSSLQTKAKINILPSPQTLIIDTIASKPVAPPIDRQTINLVPTQYQVDYAQVSANSGRKRIFSISAICLLILNMLTAYFVFLSWQAYSKSIPVSPPTSDFQIQLDNFTKSQSQINLITNNLKDRRSPYEAIQTLSTNLPPSITLSNIHFVLATQSLIIVGVSPTQADILSFKESLDKTGIFESVKLPLSVYEKREPIPFTITIKIISSNSRP